MVKKNKKIMVGIVVVLLLIGVITLSYAFLSVGGKQELGNTFQSGCLNIRIDNESDAISLEGAYPITDVEGLSTEGYTFTVKNTCSTSADFVINIENIDRQENSLSSDYLKVSINGEEFDNIVSILSSNTSVIPSVSNAYEAYTIYTGSIEGNTTRTYKIREWLDYDATKEQAASKVIKNKINVIAKSDIEVDKIPEIKFTLNDKTLIGTITGNATNAKYCISGDNVCIPSTNVTITNNSISINTAGEKRTETVATVLGNIEVNTGGTSIVCSTLDNGKRYCSNPYETSAEPDFSQVATTDEGIFKTKDDDGDTYYFRGAVENNYVKFANKYWRIIRINGDGTIRMIYDGETARTNGSTLTLETSAFNYDYKDNMYLGFKYTSGEVHGTGTDSTILGALNTWYANNLASYENKIDINAGFCGDRTPSTSSTEINNQGGTGTTDTYYGAYIRLRTNKVPSLTCQTEDFYTLTGATKGNKSLTNPIGLITGDEVIYAGGNISKANSSYYLYTGQSYWTLSPFSYINKNLFSATAYHVTERGALVSVYLAGTRGARPVINLKADVELIGTGTMNDPYVVVGGNS